MDNRLFSKPGLIKLLPALPSKWPTGRVTGLQSRCGVAVDIQWDIPGARLSSPKSGTAGHGRTGWVRAQLTAREARTITVKFPFAPAEITCDGGDLTPSPLGDVYRRLAPPQVSPLD